MPFDYLCLFPLSLFPVVPFYHCAFILSTPSSSFNIKLFPILCVSRSKVLNKLKATPKKTLLCNINWRVGQVAPTTLLYIGSLDKSSQKCTNFAIFKNNSLWITKPLVVLKKTLPKRIFSILPAQNDQMYWLFQELWTPMWGNSRILNIVLSE